ncbi:hypothetical protein [Natrinema caseinilyticum]|uniref:hypothetical protein n=1 Tax=Natrinema caseinilyticum TaxID=2961570 RepID=UPI0020C47DE1|nr:hypothetical protein [Natrinema caseinilyticum]
MSGPDDALFRFRVETFAVIRKLLPIALLAGALGGPVVATDPTRGMWIAAGFFLLVLVDVLVVNRLPLYPAHAFGIEYRFEDDPFETDRRHCVRCGMLVDAGIHRRYARQFVLLGIPLHTLAWGSNDFCRDCVALEERADSATVPPSGQPAPPTDGSDSETPVSSAESHVSAAGSSISASTTPPGREAEDANRARRVDRNDETTALELECAFE